MGIVQGHQLPGLNEGALGSSRQAGKILAHVDVPQSFPSEQIGPPPAVTYVSVPDLLLGQLYLDERPHGGKELPPGPVLHPFVLLDVLLHTANGQVLNLSWVGGGAQQGSQSQFQPGSIRYEAARDRGTESTRRRPTTRPSGHGWQRIGRPGTSLYSPTATTRTYRRKERTALPLTFHLGRGDLTSGPAL